MRFNLAFIERLGQRRGLIHTTLTVPEDDLQLSEVQLRIVVLTFAQRAIHGYHKVPIGRITWGGSGSCGLLLKLSALAVVKLRLRGHERLHDTLAEAVARRT